MTSPEYRVFDFREIAALDDTADQFRNWLSKSSSYFSDFWGDVSGYGAHLSLGQISTESYGKLLDTVSKENVCCTAEIKGHTNSIWYTSNEDLRLVIGELLCLPDTEQLGTRDLSPNEESLANLFLDNLANSLSQGWMGEEQLTLSVSNLTKDPGKKRIFRARDLVTKTSVQIELKIGKVELHWLLPKQPVCDLLETAIDNRSGREPAKPSPQMVGQLPIEVISVLGKATVPMIRLSQMAVGQLIMLDQRIDQPVVAFVNDSPFFECWPGKLGKKQALEVASCVHN